MSRSAHAAVPTVSWPPSATTEQFLSSKNWTRISLHDKSSCLAGNELRSANLALRQGPGFASGKHNSEGDGVVHLRPMNVTREGQIDLGDVRYVQDATNHQVHAGDVLFNNTNSPVLVGKTALVTSQTPLGYSNHMTRLRPPQELRSDFLAHQLHWLWMKGYFQTVLNNHVNRASVGSKHFLRRRSTSRRLRSSSGLS